MYIFVNLKEGFKCKTDKNVSFILDELQGW